LIGWLSHAHCDPRPIPAVPGAWASRHFRPMALAVDPGFRTLVSFESNPSASAELEAD
jgi:hypothetical protein